VIRLLHSEDLAMRRHVVAAAKALTAAAALFTVIWACGSPPTRPSVADLNGTWEGTIQPPPEPPLSARVVITTEGGMPVPAMTIGQTIYEPNRALGSSQSGSSFVLNLRSGQTLVTLTGQVTPDGRSMSGQITGLSPSARLFTFDRR
jgi:hypothetical protein